MTLHPFQSLSEHQRSQQSATDTHIYKQYLEAICNNATLALFVLDERQHCVYMNPAAEQMTGYTLAEVQGQALHDVIHHTRPDGTPYPLSDCPIDQVFPQNNQERGEEIFVHRNGNFYPIAYTASPIREAGTTIGTVIEVRDITAEKLAQKAQQAATERERLLRHEAETAKERAETVLSSITDAFIVLDRDWRYVYINPAATELLNRSESELIGNRIWDVFPDLVGSAIDLEYHRAVEEQCSIEFEFFYPSWNRWFVNRIYPSATGASIFFTDITDRKHTEQALRESESRFRNIFECNLIPIGTWTELGSLTNANDALLNLIGYTRQELETGQIRWNALTPPEWESQDAQAVNAVLTQGYCVPYEKEFFHKDGRRVPILITGGVLSDGSPDGFFYAIDLTHQKQTEASLREADSLLSSALSAGSIYTWRWNLITNRIFIDLSFASLFGMLPEDTDQGLPIEFFLTGMHPDDRDSVAAAIDKAIATGEEYFAEYRLLTPQGERWVLARGRVEYNTDRLPISFPGAIADITERKQIEAELAETEERLRVAIESAQLGAWDFNLVTQQLSWDKSTKAMFGLPSDAEISYERFETLLHPDDRDAVNQAVEASLTPDGSGEVKLEYRVIRATDGVERWIAATGRTLFDSSNRAIRMIGMVIDITERKQREAERQQLLDREKRLREQAEQANRIKDEFLAVLSHELRTPLNPILGWVRMLRAGKCPPAKAPQALETIERNAHLQAQLIEDLLDVSRILQGKLTLNSDSVRLVETLEAALETVQLAADSKSIQIETHLDATVEAVRGDANRLQQVFWNLLSNAVKFTPIAGRIEVTLSQVGTEAEIQIRDTGKGIRAEVLPYIFDRFRQADSSTTRQFGGLGLGLAIARHLVELHGGTIFAESAGENQGATFTVRLPLAAIALSPTQNDGLDSSASMCDLTGIRIFAIDDEPDNLDFLVFLLEAMGAIVQSAQSATLAFEKLSRFQPDLVISDIAMPDFDGYQFIQKIRQQSDVPAIALTAYAGEINQRQILAAGFQRHLAKPVSPNELCEAIVSLLLAH